MPAGAIPELRAPPQWQSVDFIADLHLNPGEPATAAAWRRYMQTTRASAIFILGDLFEAWIGDDAARPPGFEAGCAAVLREAARRCAVHFMRGNRDFLVGPGFLAACGVRDLPDPVTLILGQRRWLLSHGDALCLDDAPYQQFRRQVRQSAWQQQFLALPLRQRQAAPPQQHASGQCAAPQGHVWRVRQHDPADDQEQKEGVARIARQAGKTLSESVHAKKSGRRASRIRKRAWAARLRQCGFALFSGANSRP